jgi:hypothetical protein
LRLSQFHELMADEFGKPHSEVLIRDLALFDLLRSLTFALAARFGLEVQGFLSEGGEVIGLGLPLGFELFDLVGHLGGKVLLLGAVGAEVNAAARAAGEDYIPSSPANGVYVFEIDAFRFNETRDTGLISNSVRYQASGPTTDDWLTVLGGEVPFAPVRDVAEALSNPFVAEVGMRDVMDHPDRDGGLHMLASPVKIDGQRAPGVRAPRLGEQTAKVLGE